MKKILLITILVFFFTNLAFSQHDDYIVPTKGKTIYNITIHKVTDVYIMYEKEGSLHDILNDDIIYFKNNGNIVRLDKNEKPTDYFTDSESDIGEELTPEVSTKKPKEKTLFQKIVSMFI